MQTITKLRDLTSEELFKVQAAIRSKLAMQPNVVDVAFGLAENDGEIDATRGECVCIYVDRKSKRPRKVDRIPPQFDVRIKRGRRFCKVSLPTDVIETPRNRVKTTGREICHSSAPENRATSGFVIVWRVPNVNRLFWGVVSVGHVFGEISPVPETTNQVLLEFADEQFLAGQLLARSEVDDGTLIDASLVQVSKQELVDQGLMPGNVNTSGRKIRLWNNLTQDVGETGFSMPESDPIDFQVTRFLPTSQSVPALGKLEKVIEVKSTTAGAFARGTSGSLWQIQQQAAVIQHGGLSPQFLRGWGQSLEAVFDWARNQLAVIHGVSAANVDLRLIFAI